MRDCPPVSDEHIANLADLIERSTGKRPSTEEARAIGEDLIRFVLLLDEGDRRMKAEAPADVEGDRA